MAKIRHRIPNPTYKAVEYSELGSWNPQANDGGRDSNELFVVKNLRMQVPGQYQQRSGYKMFSALDGSIDDGSVIYSKGEYELFDNAFDLTFLYSHQAGKVQCVVLNKTTQSVQLILDLLTTTVKPDMVCGMQSATYFIYTIYGHGVFAFYPKDRVSVTSSVQTDWYQPNGLPLPLGKDLAPTPYLDPVTHLPSFGFAATTTGDLLVRQEHHIPSPNDNQGDQIILDYQPGLSDAPILRVAAQAKYWLTDDPVWAAPNDPTLRSAMIGGLRAKKWEWNKNDPTNYNSAAKIPINSPTHLQTNAWSYRAVLVQRIKDAEGNNIEYRSQASVDFAVPNRDYSPAYFGYDGQAGSTVGDFITSLYGLVPPNWLTSVTAKRQVFDDGIVYPGGFHGLGFPTFADLGNLQDAYRTYFHEQQPGNQGGAGTADPYYGAAGWLGWVANRDILYAGVLPYVLPVSAYDLKKAPMTEFHWSDFATTDGTTLNPDFPTNTIKIELYRTAFNGSAINTPAATFGGGDPLFQPHLYGYVGSIEPNGTFTDSVQDAVSSDGAASGSFLDFGKTPESYDGFLSGQFSGKVIREYNDKVAIANTVSDYWVFAPSAIQQAIAVSLGSGGTVTTSKINTTYQFFYQYEDSDGRVSDLQEMHVDTTDTGTVTSHIYFKIPLGYDPTITKVNIIRKDNSIPQFDLIAKVNITAGYYIFDLSVAPVAAPYTETAKTVKTSPEPGGIIYGQGNQIFAYPFTNQEILSKIYQITAMEVILGRLWVWTERGLFYTLLAINQNGNTLGEEETVHGGNLGFHTLTKANKIVFFLSAHGLCFAESSGVVEFVANLQNEVLSYLNETIPGQPLLANAKRATLKWLGQRDELWLHFPSSVDLGGSLPERTLLLKLWGGVPNKDTVTAEFELINSLDASLRPIAEPVVLQSYTDGTLYGSYLGHGLPDINGVSHIEKLIIINNDSPADAWMGQTIIEKRYPLGIATQKKKLRSVTFRADGLNTIHIVTGRPYPENNPPPANTPDYYGQIYKGGQTGGVNKYLLNKASANGQPQLYRFRTNGNTIETTAYIPAVRIVTEPDSNGNNTVTYYSLNAYLEVYDHP